MPPPRKSDQPPDDPEAANDTMARAPNPLAEDAEQANATAARPVPSKRVRAADPEAANATQARVPLDPETANKTQAKAPAPRDPEAANKTQAKAAAPRDPEAANKTQAKAPAVRAEPHDKTQARAPAPLRDEAAGDPEAQHKTQARVPAPLRDDAGDAEAQHKTQARVPAPLRAAADPEAQHKTQARVPKPLRARPNKSAEYRANEYAEPLAGEDASYSTGQNYAPDDEGEAPAGSLSLEGDGLEPMDPELVPRTKALPALEEPAGGQDDDDDEDANATRAGPPLKLEIVAGPDTGKTKKIKGVRMVIGRTPGVDLQLSDQSVSRRHVELIRNDGGMLLRDLGSGNGTKVNGAKVAEKQLEHGDEIAIGKTRMRFVDEVGAFVKARAEGEKKAAAPAAEPKAAAVEGEAKAEEAVKSGEAEVKAEADEQPDGEAPAEGGAIEKRARDRAKPVRTSRNAPAKGALAAFKALPPPVRLGIAGGAALVLLLVIVALATRKPPPPPVDTNRVAAEEKMQQARNAVRDAKYEEAVKLIELAEELAPGIDKTKLANGAREELAAQRGLEDARAAIAANRFEDARKILAKVGVSKKGDDDKRRVEQELVEKELEYKKQKIDEFLAAGELEAAKNVLGELPPDQQSGPAAKVAEFEKQLEDLKADEDKKDKAAAAANAAAGRARREEEIALAFAVVERKFSGGEWDRAASECARVVDANSGDREILKRAKQLQGQIPNFGRNYEEGLKKFKLGQLTAAARPLRAAWGLYNQMGLRANPYGQDLQEKLAEASISQGKEALLRSDLATAAVAFKDASKLDPSDPRGRQGLEEVIGKADDLYQEAYMIRDREPREALQKFKIVIDVTPPGSATHEKAKNQIAAMAP